MTALRNHKPDTDTLKTLLDELREEARGLHQVAWGRTDGGQEYSISAALAERAADALESQAKEVIGLREALRRIAEMTDIEADFDGFEACRIASAALSESKD